MTPDKPDGLPAFSAAELQERLRESLKGRRPRRTRMAIGSILLLAAIGGLLAWAFFPKGEPPLVVTTAFDDLAVSGKETMLQGCLEAPETPSTNLGGRDVVFAGGQLPLMGGQQAKECPSQTGPHGEATCSWTFANDTTQGDFILSQVGGKFFPGSVDHGLVFLIPANTPICLVQIEDTLPVWTTENMHAIRAAPGAAQALADIAGKGYQLVYLTLTDRVTSYQRMRGWVRRQCAESRPPFPAGPVVSRFHLPWADHNEQPWRKTAERLARRFPEVPQAAGVARTGHLALALTPEVAKQFHAAGWRTVFIGADNDLPAGIVRVAGWPNVSVVVTK